MGVYLRRFSWCGLDLAIFTSPLSFLQPEEYLKPLGFTQTPLCCNYSSLDDWILSGCYNVGSEGSYAHRPAHLRCPCPGGIFTRIAGTWQYCKVRPRSNYSGRTQITHAGNSAVLWWEGIVQETYGVIKTERRAKTLHLLQL